MPKFRRTLFGVIDREPRFFAEENYHRYLYYLEKAPRDCCCAIHAYAPMTSHVPLLLTTTEYGSPAQMMQPLGRRYV